MTLYSLFLFLAGAPAALAAEPATTTHHNESVRVDLHAAVESQLMLGLGGRFEFAVAPQGLLASSDDELSLSVGTDIFFLALAGQDPAPAPYAAPVVALQWSFFKGNWSLYPEAGAAVHVSLDRDEDAVFGRSGGWLYLEPNIAVGARYHLGSGTIFTTKVGWPGGLQAGLAF